MSYLRIPDVTSSKRLYFLNFSKIKRDCIKHNSDMTLLILSKSLSIVAKFDL